MSNKVEVTVVAPATSDLSKDDMENTSETHDKEERTHDLAKDTLMSNAN